MVTATASTFDVPAIYSTTSLGRGGQCRRRISAQAGRALEILGHAIDYLADEYVHEGGSFSAHDGQVEAVQLLMAVNRQIYLDCPVRPTMADRVRAAFSL